MAPWTDSNGRSTSHEVAGRPLPLSQTCKYVSMCVLMCIDPVTGLLQACPSKKATQQAMIQGLRQQCATDGQQTDINSDQGTHFTGHQVQEWANKIQYNVALPSALQS